MDFAIALNLVFRSLFLIYFRVTRMVLLSMLCEILLVTLLTQWLVRFRRYPKEGKEGVMGVRYRVDILPGNDLFNSATDPRHRVFMTASSVNCLLKNLWCSRDEWSSE